MLPIQTLRISASTPVLDHAGVTLYYASRPRVDELLERRDIDLIRTRTRLRALRFRGPDPALLTTGSHHRRPAGTPHRNENYFNVRGCWHIDRIPSEWRELFVGFPTS
jgi:hypothetical protein